MCRCVPALWMVLKDPFHKLESIIRTRASKVCIGMGVTDVESEATNGIVGLTVELAPSLASTMATFGTCTTPPRNFSITLSFRIHSVVS